MNLIYLVGWTTHDFDGGTSVKNTIKSKRSIGKQYDYFDVVAFKDVAEECKKIKEGSKVSIEGTLQKTSFGDKWYHSIVINEIKVLEKPQPKPDTEKEKELKGYLKGMVENQNDNDIIQEKPAPIEQLDLPDQEPFDPDDNDLPF